MLNAMRATAVAATLAAMTASASAQCVGSCETPVISAGGSGTLRLNVTASVGGRCGFATAPSVTLVFPKFDETSDTQSASFMLDCTGPSRVAVTSSNGGLKNGSATLPPGYSNFASYEVNLQLNPSSGSTVSLTQGCPSEVLRVSAPASGSMECAGIRGTANGTTGLRLSSASRGKLSYLVVKAGPETIAPNGSAPTMIDGNYTDTLTVTVAASL